MTEQFAGVIISVTQSIPAFEDWVSDDEVDVERTMARYEDAVVERLESTYPGAEVRFQWRPTEERTRIHGTTEAAHEMDPLDVDEIVQMVCNNGNPEPFIVLRADQA